mmetsp:Transcript_5369/g.20954  ORF Transcript_5369/g.20954 Transcript_5369/m.20954 type:complete len:223 (-) Transcript_5369:3528-4196(-)
MPLFHHSTLAVVLLLNGKNLVSNALTDVSVATSANRSHDETHDVSVLRILSVNRTQTLCHSRLRCTNFSWLDVVIVIPDQLSQRHEAEPTEEGGESGFARAVHCAQHVCASVVSMHQRSCCTRFFATNPVNHILRDKTAQVLEHALIERDVVDVPAVSLDWHRLLLLRDFDDDWFAAALFTRSILLGIFATLRLFLRLSRTLENRTLEGGKKVVSTILDPFV